MPSNAIRVIGHPTTAAAALLLILVLTWLCYRPGLEGPFLLDDPVNIPQTELPELSWAAVNDKIFSDPNTHPVFRTIGRLSFALTIHFHGLDTGAFKYQNLMLHLINGLLVFWLISLLVLERGSGKCTGQAYWFALAVAAIWVLHPLQVSTVLYAVQRLTLLSTLFILLALISYVKGRVLARTRPGAGFALALTGILLFGILGMMSKQNTALLPFYIATIELFVFRFEAGTRQEKRLLQLFLGVVIFVPILAALLYGAALFPVLAEAYLGRGFDLAERLMTQVHVLLMYLRLFFIPIPGEMSLFHDDFPITRALDGGTIGLLLLYATMISSAFVLRVRLPLASLGIIWFFVSHLIESTVLPLELVFEHRNYLAILGLALLLVDILWQVTNTPLLRRILPLIFASVLLMLGLNTAARAFVWGDLGLMLTTEYERRPESSRVIGYLAEINILAGNADLAKRFIDELLALRRPDAGPEIMDIMVRCEEQRIPGEVFERARKKLSNGTMSAFSFESLNQLTESFANGECPAITVAQADALLQAAVDNPKRSSVKLPCIIQHIRTKLLISVGQWSDVPASLSSAIERCQAVSRPLLHFMIADWFAFALNVGGPDRVLPVLNALPAEQSATIAQGLDEGEFNLPAPNEMRPCVRAHSTSRDFNRHSRSTTTDVF